MSLASFRKHFLISSGSRELWRMSRNSVGGIRRANSTAGASGVRAFRSSAICTSGRTDHFEWWLTVTTKAGTAPGFCSALTTETSVSRGFSSAVCQTRFCSSRRSAPATISEARRAKEILSPRVIDASRFTSNSSAMRFRSAGAVGVSANCIKSNVYNSRRNRSAKRRGVLG